MTAEMPMMTWIATEGGRKCPQCGKYAKQSELGFIGGTVRNMHLSIYGHLPGFGCNKPEANLTKEETATA